MGPILFLRHFLLARHGSPKSLVAAWNWTYPSLSRWSLVVLLGVVSVLRLSVLSLPTTRGSCLFRELFILLRRAYSSS